MSSPVRTSAPAGYRKPGADVYTALLALAVLALVLGMVCLYFEMQRFEFDLNPPPMVGSLQGIFQVFGSFLLGP